MPSGALPEFPAEHGHPYHIVVVAGQECPTHSGVPRGWGGGLVKGVRAAHKKHKEGKQKEEEKLVEEDEEEETEGSDTRAQAESLAHSTVPGSLHEPEVQVLKEEDPVAGMDNNVDPSLNPIEVPKSQHLDTNKRQNVEDGDESLKSPSPLSIIEDDIARYIGLKSPSPSIDRHTSLLHRHPHGPGSKGWSTMLDGASIAFRVELQY